MKEKTKIALISGSVSVVTALIAAGATIYPSLKEAQGAASAAATSATEAEAAATRAQEIVEANPGALATHYRGVRQLENATTSRFDFSESLYDPDGAVRTGEDWRLTIPVSGVYFVGASYRLPYGPDGVSHITPYVNCGLFVVRRNTTVPDRINHSIAFNPACSLSGVHFLEEGDQLYSILGQAGAFDGSVTGDFYSVLVGDGERDE